MCKLFKSNIVMLALLLLAVLVSPAVAASGSGSDNNNKSVFEDITGGLFSDIGQFLTDLAFVLAGLFALVSVIMIIAGWFGNNHGMFMKGVKGAVIIVLAAVCYFVAVNAWEYITGKYW